MTFDHDRIEGVRDLILSLEGSYDDPETALELVTRARARGPNGLDVYLNVYVALYWLTDCGFSVFDRHFRLWERMLREDIAPAVRAELEKLRDSGRLSDTLRGELDVLAECG